MERRPFEPVGSHPRRKQPVSVSGDQPPLRAATNSPAPGGAAAIAGPLVECQAASTGFEGRDVIAGIDLSVRPGEIVAIIGRSGCGKTTLLHLLAGLIPATGGSVEAQPAALMPQRDGLMPWATARDNAALPLRIAGAGKAAARAQADAQLRALGLGDALGRPVAALSGGMRQRVALARTLLTGRSLLLLDEPLASVDALTRSELHDLLLQHLSADGHGAVLVTHDVDEAVRLADRVLVLGGPAGEPSTLRPGPALSGERGERLEHRGGDGLRAAILAELAA
jgi:ABC-type nitrate/sulfonate/bicarbonate transport system ATPase subunit